MTTTRSVVTHSHLPGASPAAPARSTAAGRMGVGAVAGLGLLAGLSSAILALMGQARSTTRTIERAAVEAALAEGTLVPPAVPGASRSQQRMSDHLVHVRLPQGDGLYAPDGSHPALANETTVLRLAMLGDSTSVGYGTRTADELPGVLLARGIASATGRTVHLVSHGLTGARTSDLPRQLDRCLADPPDVAVILVGANDLRDMVPPRRSAAQLGRAVRALTSSGVPVVAGSCPDFGVITAIPRPLRSVLSTWSLRLAALQERATVAAGGEAVALGRLVSPQFVGNPEMFASDHFHPSGAGYERAMIALLPVAIDLLQQHTNAPPEV